jgi:cellulose synthase/poly-beta-1,6-N-acetylglucosamine synthase-like glycosyltransferase
VLSLPVVPSGDTERLPHVTVIVPVKNRRDQMLRCLDALLALDYPSYDVLVADNCSDDDTAAACRERARSSAVPVEVAQFPGTLGAVRNQAAAHARGEVVAYTDSDCLPQPGWLRPAAEHFAANPSVGIVCGRTLPEESIANTRWPATRELSSFSGRYEGCNVFYRREALTATAGFEEERGFFWEDTAAGFAMRAAGWEAEFEPDALVLHDVTYPGYRWHLVRAWKQALALGDVLKLYPQMRAELFWMRIFQRPRSALFILFVLGLLTARRTKLGVLLALPYVWLRFPRYPHPRALGDFGELVLFDAANVAGAAIGGVKAGEPVV